MLKQSILPLLASWDHVYREHATLQIYTALLPLLEACTTSPSWSVRDAYICNIALDANSSYRPASLVQLDIMPDICGASNATNNDNAPSECPLNWREMINGWWRRANHGWNMSPRVSDAVYRGDESWHDVSVRGDWMQVRKTLECLGGVHVVDSKAKTLSVLVEQPKTCHYPSEYIKDHMPTFNDVKRTVDALLGTMDGLSNLRTFRMQIPNIHTDWFDTSLSTNHTSINTTANGITSLILGPFTHSLIAHTPHLTNISLYEWPFWGLQVLQDALVAAVERSALPVEHLELKEILKEGMLASAARAIPGLKSLELQNAAVDWWGYDLDLKDLIPGLSLFTNVTSLSLPPEQALDTNYNVPWCGNAWIDDPGFEEEMHRQHDIALPRLLETVRTGLPRVERVRFGGGKWYDMRDGKEGRGATRAKGVDV